MRILCIGDSNTWGYNPANGMRFEKRWTKVLSKLLPSDEIVEEGLNGRTLTSKDPHIKERCGIDALKMLLLTHQPIDLVIIMLGTNELKNVFHCGAVHIANGIREFIKTIRNPYLCERYDVPEILVISPIHLRDEIVEKEGLYGDFNEDSLLQSKYLSVAIKKVCDTYETLFMDAAQYAEASLIDCIHMDEKNHTRLATAIADKINSIRK